MAFWPERGRVVSSHTRSMRALFCCSLASIVSEMFSTCTFSSEFFINAVSGPATYAAAPPAGWSPLKMSSNDKSPSDRIDALPRIENDAGPAPRSYEVSTLATER